MELTHFAEPCDSESQRLGSTMEKEIEKEVGYVYRKNSDEEFWKVSRNIL